LCKSNLSENTLFNSNTAISLTSFALFSSWIYSFFSITEAPAQHQQQNNQHLAALAQGSRGTSGPSNNTSSSLRIQVLEQPALHNASAQCSCSNATPAKTQAAPPRTSEAYKASFV
jgi:hypothetical protein